jgi:hypothetical protein
MKKIITVLSALLIIGCMAFVLYGCGAKDEDMTSTTNPTVATTERTTNSGMVTDRSEPDDNGIIGDIVTDMSEGMSQMITDVSEDMSRAMR